MSSTRDRLSTLSVEDEDDPAPVEVRLDLPPAPRGPGDGVVLAVADAFAVEFGALKGRERGVAGGTGHLGVREGDVFDVALHEGLVF